MLVLIVSAIVGFIFTAIAGKFFIPYLKKLHFGQTILEIGPKWHKEKQGTPIMGGIMFICGTFLAVAFALLVAKLTNANFVFSNFRTPNTIIRFVSGPVMALLMAFVGFMDDYIKAVKKQNLGLKASQKTLLQVLIAASYLLTLYLTGFKMTYIPFVGAIDVTSGLGLIFWPIALMFIYGFTNAVNLTDGVDGLASSVTVVVAAFFAVISINAKGDVILENSVLSLALVGSLLGFLIWNLHPAKVFMGDTGSMFLGGMVVAFSFYINCPAILLLAGVVYLCEALSVVIQVAYFKATKGKRLFKMSPIHHHFELSGWKENKIVVVFSVVAFVGCLLAGLCVYFG